MSRFFLVCSGPITMLHPEPFVVATMDEALELIDANFAENVDPFTDMISVYEIPEVSGRAVLRWQFTGTEYINLENDLSGAYDESIVGFPQGHLPNHDVCLLEEIMTSIYGPNIMEELAFREMLREQEDDSLDDWIPPTADLRQVAGARDLYDVDKSLDAVLDGIRVIDVEGIDPVQNKFTQAEGDN